MRDSSIAVGGVFCNRRRYSVLFHVFQMLRHLQRSIANGIVYFCDDFICIKRKNDFDKEIQVARMWKIYAGAKEVKSDVGSNASGLCQALGTIIKLGLEDIIVLFFLLWFEVQEPWLKWHEDELEGRRSNGGQEARNVWEIIYIALPRSWGAIIL
jgi:hypothetical protein